MLHQVPLGNIELERCRLVAVLSLWAEAEELAIADCLDCIRSACPSQAKKNVHKPVGGAAYLKPRKLEMSRLES